MDYLSFHWVYTLTDIYVVREYSLSCCVQILDAMNRDSELPLHSVRVDGGMVKNKLLLQLQADILGIKVGEC